MAYPIGLHAFLDGTPHDVFYGVFHRYVLLRCIPWDAHGENALCGIPWLIPWGVSCHFPWDEGYHREFHGLFHGAMVYPMNNFMGQM